MKLDELERHDPFHLVHWRWNLAERIARGDCDRSLVGDPAILTAADFLAAGPGQDSTPEYAAIVAARDLHCTDGPGLWEIQARLLAGQSDEEIANCCGAPAEAIRWYEALFFNVRDYLDRTVYLLTRVVGFGHLAGFRAGDLRGFWLWLAMQRQPRILDFVVDEFRRARRAQDSPDLPVYIHQRSPAPIELQAFVALSLVPVNRVTATWHQSLQLRVREAAVLGGERAQRAKVRLYREAVHVARQCLLGEDVAEFKTPIKPAPTSQRRREAGDVRTAMLESIVSRLAAPAAKPRRTKAVL